ESPPDSQAGGKWNTERKRDGTTSNKGPKYQVWSFKRRKRPPYDGWQALGERKQSYQQQRPRGVPGVFAGVEEVEDLQSESPKQRQVAGGTQKEQGERQLHGSLHGASAAAVAVTHQDRQQQHSQRADAVQCRHGKVQQGLQSASFSEAHPGGQYEVVDIVRDP